MTKMTQELIKVTTTEDGAQVVSARDLYASLEVKSTYRFSKWFENNAKQLVEGEDYRSVTTVTHQNQHGGTKEIQDYALTMDGAKQLAMMSGTEKGKEIRMYFIQVEKQFNSPEMVMARALQYSQQQMLAYDEQIKSLNQVIEIQAPKVEMAEKLLEAPEANISMAYFAKVLANYGIKIGRNTLMRELRNSGWLLQNNTPSAKAMEREIFQVYEKVVKTSVGTKVQPVTTITPKGQEFLIKRVTRKRDDVA